jgi:hypothetical protein
MSGAFGLYVFTVAVIAGGLVAAVPPALGVVVLAGRADRWLVEVAALAVLFVYVPILTIVSGMWAIPWLGSITGVPLD